MSYPKIQFFFKNSWFQLQNILSRKNCLQLCWIAEIDGWASSPPYNLIIRTSELKMKSRESHLGGSFACQCFVVRWVSTVKSFVSSTLRDGTIFFRHDYAKGHWFQLSPLFITQSGDTWNRYLSWQKDTTRICHDRVWMLLNATATISEVQN